MYYTGLFVYPPVVLAEVRDHCGDQNVRWMFAVFTDWGTKSAISQLRDFNWRSAWTPQQNSVNTQPTAKRWPKCRRTAKLRPLGNGWRRDGSFAPNWPKTRTCSSGVARRRIPQSRIGGL